MEGLGDLTKEVWRSAFLLPSHPRGHRHVDGFEWCCCFLAESPQCVSVFLETAAMRSVLVFVCLVGMACTFSVSAC